MAGEPYVYAVTRVRIHEQHLLKHQDMDALSAAENVGEALNVLSGKGWDVRLSPADMIERELEKTWALIAEAAGDIAALYVFRCARDFHNLKAAVKLVYLAEPALDRERYFLPYGAVPVARIIAAAENQNFGSLPDALAVPGKAAWETLKATGNGQLCEIIVDRAALEETYKAGEASRIPLLQRYAELTVDAANVLAAMRCQKLGRDRSFLERVLADAGRLSKKDLINAALGDEQEIPQFLRSTPYAAAAAALNESPSAFERWRNIEFMNLIQPQRGAISGVEPLAAYILARENEIRMVRLILSAKINQLSRDSLQERLGRTYV
ncbi:MAG: V-type ATPase subunit [Clostridiales bacterium]|jgi:V/A-type H+-transporting ATPase subunit C|nr:V-type ATPase subunit [Clostridiales bacterium]